MIGGKSIEAASLAVVAEYDDRASKGLHGLDKLVHEIAGSVTRKADQMGAGFVSNLGQIGKSIAGTALPAFKALGAAVTGLGVTAAIGLAGLGAAVVAFGRRAVQAGSSLNETVNKNEVVFKQSAQAMLAWGQTSYKAMGLSAQGALEFAGTFGNLFTSMDLTAQKSADMSRGLVQLAADLASFNNVDIQDVLIRLQSGLVGEVEPLRRLGVNLSAAAVQAKALEMGLAKTKDALTPAMLVQARYAMILEQTKNAQGDFARTSTGLANQQRILGATFEDITQKIGYELLPAITPLVNKLTEFAQSAGPGIVDSVRNMVTAFLAFQGAINSVDVSPFLQQIRGMREVLDPPTWEQIFGALLRNIDAWKLSIAKAGNDIDNFVAHVRAVMEFLKEPDWETAWSQLKTTWAELGEEQRKANEAFQQANTLIGNTDYAGLIRDQEEVNRLNKESTDYWTRHADALRGTKAAAEPVKKDLGELVTELQKLGSAEAPKGNEGWAGYLEQVGAALQDAAGRQSQYVEQVVALSQEEAAARLAILTDYQTQAAEYEATGQTEMLERLQAYTETRLEIATNHNAAQLEEVAKYEALAVEYAATGQTEMLERTQAHLAGLQATESGYYETRLQQAILADQQLADAQAGARSQLLDLTRGYMGEQAEAYANHARNIEQIEQQRDQTLAFLEATYQQQKAQLQASGDQQALALLSEAHRLKYGNTVNYYNQRIKAEQTGQANVYNVAKAYYTRTLMLLKAQLVGQLRVVASTMAAMVRATVGAYSAMTSAALAYKVAAAMGEIADIRAAIAEVEAMMAGLEGAGVAAAANASVAFDEWQDSLGSLGGSLDDVGDKLDGLGRPDSGGGSLGERIVDPIAEAARMAETLGNMIEKAIDAFNTLSDWGGPVAGWQAKFTTLTGMISWIITSFAGLADRIKTSGILEQEKREAIFNLAEMIGAVVKVYKDTAALVDSVNAGPDISAGIADLSGKMYKLVEAFAQLYYRLRQRLGQKYDFENLAKVAGQLVDALKPWETAAKAVQAVVSSSGLQISGAVDRLAAMVGVLIDKVIRLAAGINRNDLRRTAEAAGLLVEALKPWDVAAKAVQAVAEGGAVNGVQGSANRLIGAVEALVGLVGSLARRITPAALREAAQAAGLIVEALKPWDAAAKAVQAVASATGADAVNAAERLRQQVWSLIRKIAWLAAAIGPDLLQTSAQAADKIVAALKPWETMAKTVTVIAESAERSGIGPKAERLRQQVWSLIRKIAWLAGAIGPDLLQTSAQAAGLLVEALKPWEVMVKAVEAIAKHRTEVIGPKAERLIQQVGSLTRKVARMGREIGLTDLEFAARVAVLLVDALEPWDKAIKFLNELRLWREVPDFRERIDRLARLMAEIVKDLIDAVGDLEQDGLQAVAAFGTALADLMSGLEAAVVVMSDFEFTPPDPALWDSFTGWVRSVFVSYYDWINQRVSSEPGVPPVPLFDGDGLKAVSDFAAALRDLMGGLEAALGIARDFTFTPPDPAQWDSFTGWVRSVFVSYYDWINQRVTPEPGVPGVPYFDGDGLKAVSDFAAALRDLMGGLEAALGIARDFTFTPPDPAQWANFTGWVRSAFLSFYDWVNGRVPWEPGGVAVPDFDGDGLGMVTAFAGALGALMQALQTALELARDFAFTPPDPAQWANFFTWVAGVFEQFRAEIARLYPAEDPDQFSPVAQWAGALGSLMGGLQSALELARGFEFTPPDPAQWDNFFTWVTDVLEAFRAEIERRYPDSDPDTWAPVTQWSAALGALMSGLQSAVDLVGDFEFTVPDPEEWAAFFTWVTGVLEAFRAEIDRRYPDVEADEFAPVVQWAEALEALMGALETATQVADGFAFIPPSQVGWDLFFDWVWDVFLAFQTRVETEFPGTPEEALASFAPVIAFADAMEAIFSAIQSAFAFFMDMSGPGAAFWQFLAGAGDPETSPFAQQMGYIIGAITGVMAAFDAWVVQNAPTWTGNAQTLLTRVGDVIDILQDALDLFDVANGVNFPDTSEIEEFVEAVLQLFVTFAGGVLNLTQGQGGLAGTVGQIQSIVGGLPGALVPIQTAWQTAGGALTSGLVSGMAGGIGNEAQPNTLLWVTDQIRWRVSQFHGWWVPNVGVPAWTTAGHDLVAAFIGGMHSGLESVYNEAFAIGDAANRGLQDGAASGGGSANRPEGATFAPMFAGAGRGALFAGAPVASRSEVEVVIRFEGETSGGLSRRQLDELKSALVYEIKRRA